VRESTARTATVNVKARGQVLRAGRVLTVCQRDAFKVVGDEVTTHVATMLTTMMRATRTLRPPWLG
jgi:acyl-coenzyme A thioesterase PaaI-like protein